MEITLEHGSGGKGTFSLIKDCFSKHLTNEWLAQDHDGTYLKNENIVITTDSHVISPLFFLGGNIGSLSVSGTVNDLCASGAKPLYLTLGVILEEGFSLKELEKIVKSIASTSQESGVYIVAGDTKVVERGKADGIYINTTGIGIPIISSHPDDIEEGNDIILTGNLGDHEACISLARKEVNLSCDIFSDVAPLASMLVPLMEKYQNNIRCMRDPTRGGLAAVLHEIAHRTSLSMEIDEKELPLSDEVIQICEILGTDPLAMANEGKMVIFCKKEATLNILEDLKKTPYGKNASCIGRVLAKGTPRVILSTQVGTKRIVPWFYAGLLPRIC